MKRFPLVFLGLVIVLAVTAFPISGVDLPVLPDKGASEIDALLQQAVRQGTVPGVVAIVANKERILYHGAFGLMDAGKGKPNAEGFHIQDCVHDKARHLGRGDDAERGGETRIG